MYASRATTQGRPYKGRPHLKRPFIILLFICLGAFTLRLAVMTFVVHPGIGDPNHYYNMGLRVAEGQGFTIDYVWQYNHPPASIIHPEDHWMPLTAAVVGLAVRVLGESVAAALIPFVLIGALIPIIAYGAARQFGCSETGSLFGAGAAATLPEFVLNSIRTDTTILNAALVCSSIVLVVDGLKRGRWFSFVSSGILMGLAYLTRNDSLLVLPALLLTLLVYRRWGGDDWAQRRWTLIVLMPLAALVVVAPWLLRNIQVLGTPAPTGLSSMFFLAEQRDHYAYGREFTLQTLLAAQSVPQILGKRLFELAAAVKVMYTTLDIFLPVAIVGGGIMLAAARDRQKWLTLTPTIILLVGFLVAYPLLIPYKSQSGSFKKAYLTIIPLLLPLAVYALERAINNHQVRFITMALVIIFLTANAVELVRADARFTGIYAEEIRRVVTTAQTLPDTNGDGEIILMAQDPFMLRFFGMRSVMLPMENRETVLEVAQRYGVDYLMMPPNRPSLDPLYTGAETDPRFVLAAPVEGSRVVLYGFKTPGGGKPK